MPDGWRRWLDWHRVIAPDNEVEIRMLEADRARYPRFSPQRASCQGFLDFFTAAIRNRNTRRAYFKAANRISEWCRDRGMDLVGLQTVSRVELR